jgi:hypothetical protein
MSSIAIYADELSAAKNSSVFSNLKIDAGESASIQSIISDFQTLAHGRLVGSMWDNAFAKLNEFSAALLKRIEVANNMSEAIQEAIRILNDYIGDYPYLDCSQLEAIKASKKQCENQISMIKQVMYSKTTQKYIDSNGEEKTRQVNVYSDSEIAQFSLAITKLEENIRELQLLIEKLEGLEAVYAQAQAVLDSAFAGVDGFGSNVSNIVPNNKVVYVK